MSLGSLCREPKTWVKTLKVVPLTHCVTSSVSILDPYALKCKLSAYGCTVNSVSRPSQNESHKLRPSSTRGSTLH